MTFTELLREALEAIRAHALRSFLTLLGIIIGVATIVGVMSVIAGLDGYVKEKLLVLSPDVYVVTKFGIIQSREEFLEAFKRRDISWADFRRLEDLLTESTAIAASLEGRGVVKHRDRRLTDVQVQGTTANLPALFNVDLAKGRYFIDAEDQARAPVAVVGWDIKEELFPHQDPVGRELLVDGMRYKIIGLIEKKGSVLGQNQDNIVYVPIRTRQLQRSARQSLDLLVRARGGVAGVERSVDEVRAVMRALRHTPYKSPDPFGVVTAEALQTLWRSISGAAFMLMILISSVSLGVGGVVIMNIMLVSVLERTQEIGVRKAVGAHESDIRRQFLLEATLLSIGGGVVGALIGGGAALLVRSSGFPATFSPWIMAVGLGLSAVVGVVAGYWPARNAARLDAIEALRAE